MKQKSFKLRQVLEIIDRIGGEENASLILSNDLIAMSIKETLENFRMSQVYNSVIRIDRSIVPKYPEFIKKVLHPELEKLGPAEFTMNDIDMWFHRDQKSPVIKLDVIYSHLNSENILKNCLGLRDLEEIQKKGLAFYRAYFGCKAVFAWKSICRTKKNQLTVPCLVEDINGVLINWCWYDDIFYSHISPALRFKD